MRFLSLSRSSKVRPSSNHRRSIRRLAVERLEDRALLSYGFGSAFGLGSTGVDIANAVATDASGNLIVAGSYRSFSIDLNPGPGEYLLTNDGVYDGYAAKYDPAGNLVWGIQLASTASVAAWDAAVDGAGNVLIAGSFAGSLQIGAPGQPPVTLANDGSSEGYLAKLDLAGNVLWARTFGAAADPRFAYGITADASGNVYATGSEADRLFVAKYGADGTEVWSKVVSGGTGKITTSATTFATGEDLAVDANSNIYLTGYYRGKIDFNPDPKKTNTLTSVGGSDPSADVFVMRLSAVGGYVWAGSMGGWSDDYAGAIALDGTGNILVGGGYGVGANDFDPGHGTLNLSPADGSVGGYVVKLDANRNLIWGRSVAGTGSTMALDASGNVYTTGGFSGTIDADLGPGTFNLTAGGTGDVLVSELDSSGNFVWAGDILTGGLGSNGGSQDIAVDGSGNIYTVGSFRGTVDCDPGVGTYSLTATPDGDQNLFSDAFVSKLVPLSALRATGSAAPAAGAQVLRPDQVQPVFAEALARWETAGADTSSLGGVEIRIADLGGTTLGLAVGNTVYLDDNAAGWGWFIDRTPRNDSEFTRPGNQGERNRMDLLTVLEHEVGHILGKEHEDTGVMIDTLSAGTRRVPTEGTDAVARFDGRGLFVAFLDAEGETNWTGGSMLGQGHRGKGRAADQHQRHDQGRGPYDPVHLHGHALGGR